MIEGGRNLKDELAKRSVTAVRLLRVVRIHVQHDGGRYRGGGDRPFVGRSHAHRSGASFNTPPIHSITFFAPRCMLRASLRPLWRLMPVHNKE